jgi:hypothetical protein
MPSWLDRLRGYRQETTERVWSTTMHKNAPPTYVSDFILEQAWNRDEVIHQGKMAQRSSPAWYITYGLASNVFDDGFKFVSKDDPEEEIMQDILAELERMEHLKYLSRALAAERVYGHSWLFVSPEDVDYRVDGMRDLPPRIANLDVFTPEMVEVVAYDNIGAPKTLELKVLTNSGKGMGSIEQRVPINASECILFRTRPFDRSHEGLPATYSVWNALVGLEMVFHAIITYDMKIGAGAMVMTTKGAASSAYLDAAKTAMEDLSVSRVAIIPGNAVEKLEYIGAGAGATQFDSHISAFLDQIAAGSKIPRDVLVGSSAGAITGSEVNSKALYAVIQGEQSKMEPYIRELVRRMGYESDDYDIEWNVRYATDEMQMAQIRVLNAQADEAEQRIEQMSQGNNPFDMNIRFQDQEKNNNMSGRQ